MSDQKIDVLDDFLDLFDDISFSIYWKDKSSRVLGCNKYMLSMTGLPSRQEVVGKTNQELSATDALTKKTSENDELVMFRTMKKCIVEEPYVTSDKKRFLYLTIKVPLCDKDGKIIGLIGVSIDITQSTREKGISQGTIFLCMLQSVLTDIVIKDVYLHESLHRRTQPKGIVPG